MDNFVTWEALGTFALLVTINFAVVEFIKELPYVRYLKTKYVSWITAFVLILITNVVLKTFVPVDVVLYAISAIFVSTSGNGISDFNNVVDKNKRDY